jgi:excisionase family DNA binding protein
MSDIIIIKQEELNRLLKPLIDKVDNLAKSFENAKAISNKAIYSEAEAARFLSCSTKKLQQLRNNHDIGFVRQKNGRKVLYRYEHLMEYLASHELKKKK